MDKIQQKVLRINSPHGLYDELYNPNPLMTILNDNYIDINTLFWADILSESSLRKALNAVNIVNGFSTSTDIKINVACTHATSFIKSVKEALIRICDQAQSQQEFFADIETLNLACHVISESTTPFTLAINEGFLRSSDSSKEMLDNCLKPYSNPYYHFIINIAFPIILDKDPDIVFFAGRPNIVTFGIAKLLKENNPNIHLSICSHSSEYYSLIKIENLLEYNKPLFSLFDSIVLDDSLKTEDLLKGSIQNGEALGNIPNIIYVERDKTQVTIHRTAINKTLEYEQAITFRPKCVNIQFRASPTCVANVKLFPMKICYWNKCSFCAINKKYRSEDNGWDIDLAIKQLKKIEKAGCSYFWAIDEAIPPKILATLAQRISKENLSFSWQARSRIDRDFVDMDFADVLAKAGLREIRLGFESASDRILGLMKKTDEKDYLGLADKIVSRFEAVGIAVHFPVIIGFPSEFKSERQMTFTFLESLRQKYSNFSFNINVFHLDVASEIYKRWEKFGITRLNYPCDPANFLGNTIQWDSSSFPFTQDALRIEQCHTMMQMYPWYPNNAITEPYIYYRLWETSRKSLTAPKKNIEKKPPRKVALTNRYILTSNVTLTQQGDKYILYNWENHQTLFGGKIFEYLYSQFSEPRSVKEVAEILSLERSFFEQVFRLISEMVNHNFIREVA